MPENIWFLQEWVYVPWSCVYVRFIIRPEIMFLRRAIANIDISGQFDTWVELDVVVSKCNYDGCGA